MPTPEYHARLSPSSAKRWINCPASVQLSKDIQEVTSQYAEAGRLAHSIAELKARKRFQAMSKRTYTSQLKKLQDDPLYAPEMDGYTDLYVETLEQHAMMFSAPPFVAFETSVPIGLWTGEAKEDGSPSTGTADCIQIGTDTLWITDYKNGSGVEVDAEENPQMMMYALGALAMYAPVYGEYIKTVRMTIVQPAHKAVSDWEISAELLREWGHDILTPAALKAVGDNPGEPCPGDWCEKAFCPIRHTCRARRDKVLAVEAFGKQLSPLLSDAEVGDALTKGAELVSWYNALKDYALQACLAGKDIPGYKVVAGRTSRDWDDLDKAFADLQQRGVAEALLWERKPVTVAGLERALGKKGFGDTAADHVVIKPGKPTLAESSDKRPTYNPAEEAFAVQN
jgi:hypothetical protein